MAIATPLSTSGRFIVDAHGNRVRLAGVNWYGASEDLGVPVGLDVIQRNRLAEVIAGFGFNSVHGNSCNPGTSTPRYTWGQPEPYGLLTSDWANAAYPSVISMLHAMMRARTGPGVS